MVRKPDQCDMRGWRNLGLPEIATATEIPAWPDDHLRQHGQMRSTRSPLSIGYEINDGGLAPTFIRQRNIFFIIFPEMQARPLCGQQNRRSGPRRHRTLRAEHEPDIQPALATLMPLRRATASG